MLKSASETRKKKFMAMVRGEKRVDADVPEEDQEDDDEEDEVALELVARDVQRAVKAGDEKGLAKALRLIRDM